MEQLDKKQAMAESLKSVGNVKGFFGLVKIALLFVGIGIVAILAIPIAPFVLTYFLYDRRKKYQEFKMRIELAKLKETNRMI